MTRIAILMVFFPLLLGHPQTNLLKNGGFEEGRDGAGPSAWQRPDGLTTCWVRDPGRGGRIMTLDTGVLVHEYRARQVQMASGKPPPAKAKTPPGDRILDTVAAHEGVCFLSDPVTVEKGTTYRLRLDCRVEPGLEAPLLQVFVLGYFPYEQEERLGYKASKRLKADETWRTFFLDFDPTARTPHITRIRVKLFACWPPGLYHFDDVVVSRVPDGGEEAERD